MGFVVFVVFAELSVVGNGGVEGLAGCQGSFECGALRGDFGVAEGKSTTVEIIAALPGLSADHSEMSYPRYEAAKRQARNTFTKEVSRFGFRRT